MKHGLNMKHWSLLLPALLCSGCPTKREDTNSAPARKVLIFRITAHDRTASAEKVPGLSHSLLLSWVKKRLATAPGVVLVPAAQQEAYAFRMEVDIARQENNDTWERKRMVMISARAELPGPLDNADLQASSISPLPWKRSAEKDKAQIQKRINAVLDDFLFQADLIVAPGGKLVQALAEKDAARVAATVEIVAVRRVKMAVPALIRLLQHPDQQISDRVIGALVAIGDRQAVKHLARRVDLRNTAQLAKILDAIGALGGEEAKDYLEFVATGHDDADIRDMAAEALERLKRREGKP